MELRTALNTERARVQHYQQCLIAYEPNNVDRRIKNGLSALTTEQNAHRELQDEYERLRGRFDQEANKLNDVKRRLQEAETMLAEKSAGWQSEHLRAEALQRELDQITNRPESEGPSGADRSQPARKKRLINRRPGIKPTPIAPCKPQLPMTIPNGKQQEPEDLNLDDEMGDRIEVSIKDVAEN